ncbi:MAG: M28 family peptidase [Leptospiraceae bacterium]|nr:M28 family peptidase [Leptospiraceae bacterium]
MLANTVERQVLNDHPAPGQRTALRRSWIVLLILLASLGCKRESAALREQDLHTYIHDLAAIDFQGRESGSRNSRRAAFYIANRYRLAGLTPAFRPAYKQKQADPAHRSVNDPGKNRTDSTSASEPQNPWGQALKGSYVRPQDDPTLALSPLRDYIQPFQFKAGVQSSERNRISIQTVQGQKVNMPVVPFPLSRPHSVSGPLVMGGYCIHAPDQKWDDFAGLDVKDKIVLCMRHGPGGKDDPAFRAQISFQAKWQTLAHRKALGVIFAGRPGFPLPGVQAFVAERRAGPAAAFAEYATLARLWPGLHAWYAAASREQALIKPGQQLGFIRLQTDFEAQNHLAYNTAAWLRPWQPGQRVLVIGAHLDHLGYGWFSSRGTPGLLHRGADDNASGTALVLELAQALVVEANQIPPNANILFIHFDAEERGLFGSRHYVHSDWFLSNTEAMINLDMVGRLRKSRGISVQGCQTADPRWGALLARNFATWLGGGSLQVSNREQQDTPNGCAREVIGQNGMRMRLVRGGNGPSDHSAFYARHISIGFFFTGSHQEYHTERDLPQQINTRGLVQLGQMLRGVIRDWARLDRPLQFTQALESSLRSDFDFQLRLGIVPGSYEGNHEGLLVGDVQKNAPVYAAGLRAGDVIVKIGDTPIHSIDDVTEFLSNASSARMYNLHYVRGKQRYTLQTELMSR